MTVTAACSHTRAKLRPATNWLICDSFSRCSPSQYLVQSGELCQQKYGYKSLDEAADDEGGVDEQPPAATSVSKSAMRRMASS